MEKFVESDPRQALLLPALQLMLAVFFFYTGLQKLLYGYYAGGEYLAFEIAHGGHFGDVFKPFVPAAEFARLRALDPLVDGSGPYRVDAWPFQLASNAVIVAELALPIGLL